MTKVSVIGTGFVGASSAFALALQGICSDLLLVDANRDRAKAEAADISHGAAVAGGVRVHSGDYADIKGSAVIIIAAGVNQKPDESRLALLTRNAEIFKSIVPQIVTMAPEAVVIVATNPVDIMTDVTRTLHPQPQRVLGTGTVLDTARFRDLLGRESGVSPRYIHANVLGEHGDSSVLCWAHAQIAGLSVKDYLATINKDWTAADAKRIEEKVRGAAGTIIAGKQATYYGIGAAVAKIVEAILKDSRAVMTVSGISEFGLSLALPNVVGKEGIMHSLMPALSEAERRQLQHSADILRQSQQGLIENGKLLV